MISKFSVKKPYTVLVGVILVIVLGVVSFLKMTTDLLPNLSLPYVIVMTTYPGASPETVETVVTRPVESGMATVSNIESISSVSSENYSMVILEFAQSANMDSVSLEIRESLDQIKAYWDDSVGNPVIMKLNPDMLPVLVAAAGVEGMDDAQVSAYVEQELVPEIESLEGVASVSTSGILEESVNVIISREKVDEMNQKVFAAIDKKMEEAEQELADGKKELVEGKKELADGKKELAEGEVELLKGQEELEKGKEELRKKRDEAAAALAENKQQLLTAKADLEAAKIQMTTDLSAARTASTTAEEIGMLLAMPDGYRNAYDAMIQAQVSDGDAAAAEQYRTTILNMKASFTGSMIMEQVSATSDEMKQLYDALKVLDWTSREDHAEVQEKLDQLAEQSSTVLELQLLKMVDVVNGLTMGLGLEAYEVVAKETLATLEQQILAVNTGLIELEKGELSALVEFAGADTKIQLGEYQMQQAQSQLDKALEQLESGETQLESAMDELTKGEEQLADAKEEAYHQADMVEILTVDTIKGLLTAQNFSMPAGYVTEDGVDYLVRVGDKPSDVEMLRALPLMDLHMEDVPVITLGDVAEVFYTDNSAEIYTNVNGSRGVMLSIQKQTGYSTGDVSDRIQERFAELSQADPDLKLIVLSDQGIFIDLVMDSIISNVLLGGLLAVLILIAFLKDIRPTLIVACSIPVSLVTAVVCMYFSGVTLNVISLSGLALGIGMLVDNSIVVIENIYRLRAEGYSSKEASIEGAKEVAGAIAASTLTTICVFLPIVFMEGITKQLFVDMGLTIAYSLLASLVIALTVVPAMAAGMLKKEGKQMDGRFLNLLSVGYEKLLDLSLQYKSLVFVLVLALLVVSGAAAFSRGTAFMPQMESTQLTVSVQLEDDATLQETAEVTNEVVERLLEFPEIMDVGAMTNSSSASIMGGSMGGNTTVNATTVYVTTVEERDVDNAALAEMILESTQDLNAKISVETASMDMTALSGSGISIQVQGKELDELRKIAGQVAEILAQVEGTKDVSDGMEDAGEELRIVIDREKAISYGLTVAQVYTEIYGRLAEASTATTLVSADKDYNVYVSNEADMELTREQVKELEIDGTDKDGKSVKVALKEIADFEDTEALSAINRADQVRYIAVSAAIADGYNVGLVSTEAEEKLSAYELPAGYKLVFSGENEMINEALGQVALMLVLALVFMYLIMVAQFQSLLSPFIIMFTIPLAFTGGFMGLYLSGSEVSVIAMLGFVMLSGIIVNNGIVLIDYINQLCERGMEKHEAILEAGRTRLRPVLMTALTTILALSTMVFSKDMGAQMTKPMSIVTIGGLVYGTLLTLIVIPCIYDLFIRNKKQAPDFCVSSPEDAQ